MALIFLQKSSYQVLNDLSKTQMHCFWWALIHLEGLNLPCVLKSAVSLGKARSAFKAKVNLYQTWRFLELSSRTVSACMDSSAKCDSKQSQKDWSFWCREKYTDSSNMDPSIDEAHILGNIALVAWKVWYFGLMQLIKQQMLLCLLTLHYPLLATKLRRFCATFKFFSFFPV